MTPARPNFSRSGPGAQEGRPAGCTVHDLRHTGNHFAATSGATTRELMGRMGHVSVDAAMIYQHRTASGTARSRTRSTHGRTELAGPFAARGTLRARRRGSAMFDSALVAESCV